MGYMEWRQEEIGHSSMETLFPSCIPTREKTLKSIPNVFSYDFSYSVELAKRSGEWLVRQAILHVFNLLLL